MITGVGVEGGGCCDIESTGITPAVRAKNYDSGNWPGGGESGEAEVQELGDDVKVLSECGWEFPALVNFGDGGGAEAGGLL